MNGNQSTENKAILLEIQRLSTEDGPGIRTTVFMKGCPMRCLWCHNPESIPASPQVHWIASRCMNCQLCIISCPQAALAARDDGIKIDREKCEGCGICAETCPTNALERLGNLWEVNALADELLKDTAFFTNSGGGITISGGEATLQYDFVSRLLSLFREKGIHTAIDTCGITRQAALESILPHTDLVLFDLKEMDYERHLVYTGQSLDRVLQSLEYICHYIRKSEHPINLWIRTPIIPKMTNRPENIRMIGEYIRQNCFDLVTRWDLLAFNNLCKDKYQRLDITWQLNKTELITEENKTALINQARSILPEHIVQWSGSSRKQETGDFASPSPVTHNAHI